MKSPEPGTLTDVELEIMNVVWELGKATVREVHETLQAHRPVAYTTVMTMLGVLVRKGHLNRTPEGRAYRYAPVHAKGRVVSRMVDDFVRQVFQGSARPLVLALLNDRKISRKELDEIARLAEEAR